MLDSAFQFANTKSLPFVLFFPFRSSLPVPLTVVCPGCKKSFTVSEKFAGQKGPCPKCKGEITIPELGEEIVVHAPESETLKDSKGRSVSKPILREETKFSPKVAIGIGAAVLVVLVLAVILRRGPDSDPLPAIIPILAAVLLAPPLVIGSYTFLRSDELEPYDGMDLLIRGASCAAAYAFLWGAYWFLSSQLGPFGFTQVAMITPVLVLAGGFAAFASLDLDYLMGLVHYAFYLLVTGGLALFVGIELYVPAAG
ncbi:MAG: hypothetical protein H8E66_15765 [Planctomycetes bacterium]|nr:hypothetical protein [Planctomycetota bacterium]